MNVLFFSISMKCFRSTNAVQAIICCNGDNGIKVDELWLVMEGLQERLGFSGWEVIWLLKQRISWLLKYGATRMRDGPGIKVKELALSPVTSDWASLKGMGVQTCPQPGLTFLTPFLPTFSLL